MNTSARRTPTLALASAALAGTLLLTGCGGDGEEQPQDPGTTAPGAQAPEVAGSPSAPASDSATSATPSAPTSSAKPPTATEVQDKALQRTAAEFVNERENQASHYRKKPQDWIADVKPYMTAAGHKELSESASGGLSAGGNAWTVSHDEGLAVKTEVGQCKELSQAGSTATTKTVSCPVMDLVIDKEGKKVATNKVPPMWPYVGEQQDALLEMKKEGGGWKVNRDATGLAN